MNQTYLKKLTSLAILLAFCVILLGAYTRLSDAGLGCPDWPGCYGQLFLSHQKVALEKAQQTFPHQPIEVTKAWTEMIHRYLAGTLGLLIISIALITCRLRIHLKNAQKFEKPSKIPYLLLILLTFQALLGMWTVTLKLLPVVVMGHLLGGVLIFGSLVYFRWQLSQHTALSRAKITLSIATIIVFLQIALGGWVSVNYAGIACIGFPTCNGAWLPSLDCSHAFQFILPTKLNYQGGLLDSSARITIQMFHRFGALITFSYLISILAYFYKCRASLRPYIILTFFLLLLQLGLGISNVIYLLPLSIAVMHNGVAILLFASILSLHYLTRRAMPC